ncbi:hypothetical protein HYY71_07075 [Candidatus Woesearchaeota archaeon]|nr:hypothetical protein [Candidatus Woesearchaeota archaeon]
MLLKQRKAKQECTLKWMSLFWGIFQERGKLQGVAWKSMYMDLFIDVMSWLTEYHQRSHSESFHSSFKTRYGIITKRRLTTILIGLDNFHATPIFHI